jgi:amidase
MDENLSRRELLRTALALSVAGALAGCAATFARKETLPLAELDAVGTAEAIRRGDITAQEAVEAAIRRAEAVEPRINAVVTEAWDRARTTAAGALSGPFAGVPTFIKDLDDVRGLPTHSGSRSFGHEPATGQGPYVDALERAGLVFLGKSSTPELGLTGSTEPLLHGPTRNPWNPDFSPGGSSGGAAALVAARVVPIAHATDGGGSIRVPASCCGVFGLKPSRGRAVPLGRPVGPVDIAASHAVSISVRDSARWLAVTERTGDDKAFPPDGMVPGPSSRRLRIAVDLETLGGTPVDAEVRAAIEDTARKCESLGHRVEVAPLGLAKREFTDAFVLYWSSGAARIADDLTKRLGRPVTTADLEPWTLGLRDYFLARRDRMKAAIATLQASVAAVDAFFDRHDVLLTPVLSRITPRVGELAPDLPFQVHFERALGYLGFTPVQNASGTPGMSVPLHWSQDGLPIGSHFAGRAGGERTLLELAYELEAAFPWAARRPPISAT